MDTRYPPSENLSSRVWEGTSGAAVATVFASAGVEESSYRNPDSRLPVPPNETSSSFLAAFIGNSSLPFILSLEIENSPGKGGIFVGDAFQSGYTRQ